MGAHDAYGKQVLRRAAGGTFQDWGPSVEVDYGAGERARIDGVVAGVIAVEVESRTSKQVRGAVLDLINHPYPKKLLDILEVGDKEGTVEVSYRIEYEADVTYDDPDMTSYDSETGESFSWGTREDTVHRVTLARAEVGVLFDGLDPDSFEINHVTVTEPSDSFAVPLYDPRDDK